MNAGRFKHNLPTECHISSTVAELKHLGPRVADYYVIFLITLYDVIFQGPSDDILHFAK